MLEYVRVRAGYGTIDNKPCRLKMLNYCVCPHIKQLNRRIIICYILQILVPIVAHVRILRLSYSRGLAVSRTSRGRSRGLWSIGPTDNYHRDVRGFADRRRS